MKKLDYGLFYPEAEDCWGCFTPLKEHTCVGVTVEGERVYNRSFDFVGSLYDALGASR